MANTPRGRLHVLNGPLAGKRVRLFKALIILGKPGVQVAVIWRRPQGYFLIHIESYARYKTYPLVNGNPIGSRLIIYVITTSSSWPGSRIEFSLNQ